MTDAAPETKAAANPRHKWYIVHAYSNFEKKVAEQLRDQATQKLRTALGDKAYATYVTWKLEQRGHHRGERLLGLQLCAGL